MILCSNCSNTFNKVLTTTGCHIVKLLFANSEHPFCLQNMSPRMVEAFHQLLRSVHPFYHTPISISPTPTLHTITPMPPPLTKVFQQLMEPSSSMGLHTFIYTNLPVLQERATYCTVGQDHMIHFLDSILEVGYSTHLWCTITAIFPNPRVLTEWITLLRGTVQWYQTKIPLFLTLFISHNTVCHMSPHPINVCTNNFNFIFISAN